MRARPLRPGSSRLAWLLWTLSGLFLARVLGQILVVFLHVPYLPTAAEWYSGLLPYPLLLPTQIAILAAMGWLNSNATREQVEACHPQLAALLRRKDEHDPGGLFSSDWHAHTRALLEGE